MERRGGGGQVSGGAAEAGARCPGFIRRGLRDRGVSRRAVLAGAAGLALAPHAARASDGARRFSEPPWANYRSAGRRQREAARLLAPEAVAAESSWRKDMDHSHLADVETAATLLDRPADDAERRFVLTPDVLSALLAVNELSPIESSRRMDETLVLFALRACTVVDPARVGLPLDSVELAVAEVDHLRPRCVLGVWRRVDNRIAVFSGSTVPNRHSLTLQAAAFARAGPGRPVWRIANVLPTGRHEFTVGAHGGWQPTALRAAGVTGAALVQPALRSSTGRLAWRDLTLDAYPVLDNIHPAVTPADAYGAAFSSEGCLTLAEREPPLRWSARPPDWTTFLAMAEAHHRPTRERRIHSLALLTGAEAWLAARGSPAPRLRYGSRGPGVAALRQAMAAGGGDSFDAAMLRRWMTAGGGAGPVAFPVPPAEPEYFHVNPDRS